MIRTRQKTDANGYWGMTLIELIIVMAVMSILLTIAVPSYTTHMLRVHRSEAIRMLLQASICQEKLSASTGHYDTGSCLTISKQERYRLSYSTSDQQGLSYIATATPIGGQRSDPCGSLSVNQSGVRAIGGKQVSVAKCWNGR